MLINFGDTVTQCSIVFNRDGNYGWVNDESNRRISINGNGYRGKVVSFPKGTTAYCTISNARYFNGNIKLPNNTTFRFTLSNCFVFNRNIELPNTVQRISFSNSRALTNMVVPNSVEGLYGVFSNCWNLRNITLPDKFTTYSSPYEPMNMSYCFFGCKNFNDSIIFPKNTNSCAYMLTQCTNYNVNITIPNTVTSCISMLRNCYNFNSKIVFEENSSVTNLDNMLSGCSNYKQNFIIPNSVIDASNLFFNSQHFNATVVTETNSVLSNMTSMFNNCKEFNSEVHISGNNLSCVYAFLWCSNLNSRVSLDGVKYGSYLFSNCYNLNSEITINCDSYGILSYAFLNCRKFNQNFIIPRNAADIGYMFGNCWELNQNIFIPNTVQNCMHLFSNASNMSNVTIEGNRSLVNTESTYFRNMFANHNSEQTLNIWVTDNDSNLINNLKIANLCAAKMTWETVTNGFYNSQYNVYIYNNASL